MLEALISFFPTEGAGAIGALDWSAAERKKLAVEVRSNCPTHLDHFTMCLTYPLLSLSLKSIVVQYVVKLPNC